MAEYAQGRWLHADRKMIRQQNQSIAAELRPLESPHALQLTALRGAYPLDAALASIGVPPLSGRASVATFLQCYATRVCAVEFAVIQQAFTHTVGGHSRELIALDQSLVKLAELRELTGASALVGRLQLENLRPLRDERLVQRYWDAVEKGATCGHHWVVHGMTLALYSVPLRQGLLDFGRETLRDLAAQSAKRLALPEAELAEPLAAAVEGLPNGIETVLSGGGWVWLGVNAG